MNERDENASSSCSEDVALVSEPDTSRGRGVDSSLKVMNQRLLDDTRNVHPESTTHLWSRFDHFTIPLAELALPCHSIPSRGFSPG